MLSAFFIDRPRFAIVISVVIVIAGLVALMSLPVSQYPNITPSTIQVTGTPNRTGDPNSMRTACQTPGRTTRASPGSPAAVPAAMKRLVVPPASHGPIQA